MSPANDMTQEARCDLRALRRIGYGQRHPAKHFRSTWARKPLEAALEQYMFERKRELAVKKTALE
ncbi:hypothetical protein GGP66_003494 [Salinibacter ruber]|jgi:hypothetical protein|nr:hypothetical protein [Salinibacter ruber]MCS3676038.1 hypothetical protein [Salinibacter ruber]